MSQAWDPLIIEQLVLVLFPSLTKKELVNILMIGMG
jgi:hypothetical protein